VKRHQRTVFSSSCSAMFAGLTLNVQMYYGYRRMYASG